MAGRRVSGSETNVLLRNEDDSVGNYEALLSSNSSRAGFSRSKSMLNIEEIYGGSAINQQYLIPREIEDAIDGDIDDSLNQPGKKRRLSITQVQFLEKSFEVENKLEPERKVQLAKEIGLQPRQVAIWFQNCRARWKTKQLEKDYNALKSSYNALKVSYENMLKEKEELKGEVTHLTDLLQETYINMAEEKSAGCKSFIDIKPIESGTVKQEAQSSTISAVSESDSPHSTSRARTASSNAFEAAHSGTSYIDHNEEVKEYHEFFKLEDHSGNFDFPVEDHPFWLWS